MLRISAVAVVLGACASPPDTCDQHVTVDLSAICHRLFQSVATGTRVDLTAPFSCDGGGSGTMNVDGAPAFMWNGVFNFDACTMTFAGDTLTLSGTITFRADDMNNVYAGQGTLLDVRGTVSGCEQRVDDKSCAGSWVLDDYPCPGCTDSHGTLCGRDFP